MKPFIFLICIIFATFRVANSQSSHEVHAFVDGHNNRRLQVAKGEINGQPSASKMYAVVWDHELYVKARAYAATRPKSKHNSDRTVPSGRFTTGENLYWKATTDRNANLGPETAIRAWFQEYENYTYGVITKSDFDGSKDYQIGHYTQMVWSTSVYIGCAITDYWDGRFKNFYVVCNYGPAGNVRGQAPYKKGGPSSTLTCGCPRNTPTCDCKDPYSGH